jgi:hypothetical protein
VASPRSTYAPSTPPRPTLRLVTFQPLFRKGVNAYARSRCEHAHAWVAGYLLPSFHRRLFAAGATDTFTMDATNVGLPKRIRLVNTSDTRIHSWYCSTVSITLAETGKKVTFDVDAWLSKYEGECALEVTRVASKTPKGGSRYSVRVSSGAAQQKRCTARVSINLFGSNEKVRASLGALVRCVRACVSASCCARKLGSLSSFLQFNSHR